MKTKMIGTTLIITVLAFCAPTLTGTVSADTFGSGDNQFTIDFVPISADTNPTEGFGIVNYSYFIGVYEITYDQWQKFENIDGVPNGYPPDAYDAVTDSIGNQPINRASTYETLQFINWLNTSKGYHAAYKFNGTKGTGDYTFDAWTTEEAWGGTNMYRHKDAHYFLPNEDEWVKAAYWNGSELQSYANASPDDLDGDGFPLRGIGSGWNYGLSERLFWDVGSGVEELNGTYDMMGNIRELMESAFTVGDYGATAPRVHRGGYSAINASELISSFRQSQQATTEASTVGFRVAYAEPPLDGDANGDGKVDDVDATILAVNWGRFTGANKSNGDFSGDGVVDEEDAAILAAHWAPGGIAGSTAVPEPAALLYVLTLCLGFAFIYRGN